MGDRTNKTNGTNERFWRYPISPIGRIGLISPILNAPRPGIVFNTYGCGETKSIKGR